MASEDGGPAHPQSYRIPGHSTVVGASGLSIRQYAAITLRVPNSGTDWLDAMIRESLRDEFAGKAMAGIQSLKDERTWRSDSGKSYDNWLKECFVDDAKKACMAADAMLVARKEAADGNRD